MGHDLPIDLVTVYRKLMADRVEAGADFLDKNYKVTDGDADWFDASLLKLEELNVSDNCGCVLGQLCGNDEDGLAEFGLDDDDDQRSVYFGFQISERENNIMSAAWQYVELTKLWITQIIKRRLAKDGKPTKVVEEEKQSER